MKNKLLVCLCVLAALFTSCKQDNTDLFEIDSRLAQKNLQGIYVYVDVDTVAMNTTLHEWKLQTDTTGKVGYYRLAATGNGKDADENTPLTWSDAVMSSDYLYMTVPVQLKGGVNKDLLWADGVISVDDYTTTKFDISEANVLRKLHNSFKNYTFAINDTTPAIFLEKNMVKYLVWNTEQRKNVPVDTVKAYNEYLATMKDTIAWYNDKFGTNIPDTVKGKPNTSGIYAIAIFPIAKEKKEIVTDTIKYGPAKIINSTMTYDVDENGVYKGNYSLRIQEWSLDYYMDPAEPTATWSDTTYSIVDALWTPCYYINGVTFSVLFKGHETVKMQASEAGKEIKNYTKENPLTYHTVNLSEYDTFDSIPTIKVGDIKYSLVK